MQGQKNVTVFGGTGLIGSRLVGELAASGYEIQVLARNVEKTSKNSSGKITARALPNDPGDLSILLEGSWAVFNFSGAPIFKRWSAEYKKEIIRSRVDFTRMISNAINGCHNPPRVFVNGS
ncbi:MAG: NAD-dependent epimerase/dehydratase family protein, partial [Thermoplasmataceae archaeon]